MAGPAGNLGGGGDGLARTAAFANDDDRCESASDSRTSTNNISGEVDALAASAERDLPPSVLVVSHAGAARSDRTRALRALAELGEGVEVVLLPELESCRGQLRAHRPDLILLSSPVDDELERFLAECRDANLPVVVLLRDPGVEPVLRAFRAGATDCIPPDACDVASRVLAPLREPARRPRSAGDQPAGADGVEPLRDHTENILNHMNSALLVVDAQARTTFANPAAESILRANPGGLRGRSLGDFLSDTGSRPNLVQRTLDEGKSFKGAETVVEDLHGAAVPIGLSCSPLRDASGQPQGAVAIFQDLSEIKQLQSQVMQSEKMASIGQLAAGVAHEINNPMGFIHANLSQLSEYVVDLERVWHEVEALRAATEAIDEGPIKQARERLEAVASEVDLEFVLADIGKALLESQEGSERIRHIVQDLRDFSRTDGDGPIGADINLCIDSTANIAWTMMKHCVVLEKDYGDLPLVRCFPMQLQQVFMNLLVNAYQAIQERVADSGEMGRIELKTRVECDGVRVHVRDTGAGIEPENRGRIFEPFFTTKPVGSGTGLGLSNSYSIVLRHGGTMTVDSEVGRGSCFELWLPLDPADALEERECELPPEASSQS